MNRVVIAFFVAPLLVPLVIVSLVALSTAGSTPILYLSIQGAMSALFAYGGVLLIGWPTYFCLRARGWTSLWIAILFGFIIGDVTMSVSLFVLVLMVNGASLPNAYEVLSAFWSAAGVFAGILGALVGVTFWLIVRPDRATKRLPEGDPASR